MWTFQDLQEARAEAKASAELHARQLKEAAVAARAREAAVSALAVEREELAAATMRGLQEEREADLKVRYCYPRGSSS